MKKSLVLAMIAILLGVLFNGCASSKVTTDIGTAIGNSFQESAAKGTISAEQSIKAWPYISGQIKGLLSKNYELEISPIAKDIIDELDDLAYQETLTDEEKGFVIGSFVRLEAITIKDGWDKYGVSLMALFKKAVAG